jgi:hypothetical protein
MLTSFSNSLLSFKRSSSDWLSQSCDVLWNGSHQADRASFRDPETVDGGQLALPDAPTMCVYTRSISVGD